MKLKFKTLERFMEYCKAIMESWIFFSKRIKSKIHYILKLDVIDKFLFIERYSLAEASLDAAENEMMFEIEKQIVDLEGEGRLCKEKRFNLLMKNGVNWDKSYMIGTSLSINKWD